MRIKKKSGVNMDITLDTRTEEHVVIYFNKTNNDMFRKTLPQKAQTTAEAIEDYKKTLLPNATSYGRTILADGQYVGDVWCYCIDHDETPNAMISYCIFEPSCWNCGIATKAVALFIQDVLTKYNIHSLGAFTFSHNIASVKVLEKNGFTMMEEFIDNGIPSKYFEQSFA